MTPSRALRFPSDRSVGWLRARGPQWPDMPHGILLGDARGDIPVPDDCAPRLLVESTAARDLSFLSPLQPGDLDALELTQTQVTDEQLRHVPHLSGPRRLSLSDTDVTDRALMHLRPWVALQWLTLWWCRGITDAAVPDLLALLQALRRVKPSARSFFISRSAAAFDCHSCAKRLEDVRP
ncbi:hypothetical protein [Corallococcus exiguus]|uniref:Leucine-rich repeat domain-containing protein n=1 Tax=Corallococcus exiguus TaxID=83462 RepID=A0A7X4YH25_9BACT|nr:hypothetical protein [Corallococcus exiguus]NBC45273.1 hypothetical protein [Corallococcus exiguus]TNV55247.1 hypothetical protein FH620_31810 [Corallococcus exiguus]